LKSQKLAGDRTIDSNVVDGAVEVADEEDEDGAFYLSLGEGISEIAVA
jgi:hypothetical protein